jgi:hypothetical protein
VLSITPVDKKHAARKLPWELLLLKSTGKRVWKQYSQAVTLCGIGCLLIAVGVLFPYCYTNTYSYNIGSRREYQVEAFTGNVSLASPIVEQSYDSDYWLEAVEIRDFFTNSSPVIFHISDMYLINETIYNLQNYTAEPINLSFNVSGPVHILVGWNNTPATFSCWVFARSWIVPPVIMPAPNLIPGMITALALHTGLFCLIYGIFRRRDARRSLKLEYL